MRTWAVRVTIGGQKGTVVGGTREDRLGGVKKERQQRGPINKPLSRAQNTWSKSNNVAFNGEFLIPYLSLALFNLRGLACG